ncbi:unnamed protein product [Rotaria sordida]|uniref:Uncharacterized protein n=1 Tax=Rotaria sordida TaxID=392033 RepID=A0A819CQY6_9BILA|nr:unnamed protein product [Rotaria sordida]
MPTELRESSPNLPPEFNIATITAPTITTTTTMNIPPDALPQREIFARKNTTQPFTLEEHSRSPKNTISGRGNQAYVLASVSIYDEWVRNNYELQVWQAYLKMGTEQKHWAKEVVRRTKRRDNVINTRFVQKKINRLPTVIAEAFDRTRQTIAVGSIETDTDNELGAGTTGAAPTTTVKNYVRKPVERIKKYILEYIHFCTQHVKKRAQTRIQLAKAQMEEYKALEDFEQIAILAQWNTHFLLKPKVKLWLTKNKNYQILSKRVELDMPPKIIDKVDFSFKIDESIISQDETQAMYNQMRQITKDFRTQAMTLYVQSAARENEILSNEIKGIIERFPQENDDGFDAEPGYAAFKQYHELREKRMKLEIEQSLYFLFEQRVERFLAPAIINEANMRLTEEEHQLLKFGPKFIFNDSKTAARRRITGLATLKRKIEKCFLRKKVSPGRPLQQFIVELDVLLQTLHNISITSKNLNKSLIIGSQMNQNDIIELINSQASQSQVLNGVKVKKKKNYGRLVKRLKHKFRLANVMLQKSDKSKVFHLGKIEDYRKKSNEYMEKTQAYKCLGKEDPLPDLIKRTNKYLLDLRLAKWITQKHYELLSKKPNEVELAHLYYLPKAHKPGTRLRPIISGL